MSPDTPKKKISFFDFEGKNMQAPRRRGGLIPMSMPVLEATKPIETQK
jgi:hypothetical protein